MLSVERKGRVTVGCGEQLYSRLQPGSVECNHGRVGQVPAGRAQVLELVAARARRVHGDFERLDQGPATQ